MKYKIGEFAKLVDVPIKTLRYYDDIGLFKPKEVDLFSHYRYYLDSQIEDLNLILELKEAGFQLVEIKRYWNNWNNAILLNQKEKIYLEQEELDRKIKKIDELRFRLNDGMICQNKVLKVKVKERRK